MRRSDIQQVPRPVHRVAFEPGTDMGAVEQALALAILAVGCLHGESAVRLEVGYAFDTPSRLVVLEGTGPLATAVARVFVGVCAQEQKTRSFRVLKGGTPLAKEGASSG